MGGISKEKYLESLFTILKGRLPNQKEKDFFNSRYGISTTPLQNIVESVTGTAVDNTDPLNPVIDTLGNIQVKEYASFYLSTGGLTGQAGTTRTVIINNTLINSNPLVFILLANEITVNKTGNFKIDFGCYFNNSSSSRTEYTFWLEKNGVEVQGSRSGNYQRGYDSGQSSDIHLIIPIISGDVLRVRVNRTDGGATTGYQDDNGTRFTIEEK